MPRLKLIARHWAQFLLRGGNEDAGYEVDAKVFTGLRNRFGEGVTPIEGFFGIPLLDGNYVVMNSAYLQGVHLQSDVVGGAHPVESSDPIKICLCGREPFEVGSPSPIAFFDLCWQLQLDVDGFVPYDDGEDRPWAFCKSEVVWVSGPLRLVDQGEQMAIDESELSG